MPRRSGSCITRRGSAPEGEPSASIIRGGTKCSKRERTLSNDIRYDLAANDRRTRQRRATRQRRKRQERERRERVGRPRGGMKVAARIGERLWSLRSLCRVVGVVGAGHRFPGHRLLFFCEKRKGLIMHTPGSCHDVSDCDTAATYGDYHSPPARLSAARIQPQPAGAAQYDRGSLDGNDSPRISP